MSTYLCFVYPFEEVPDYRNCLVRHEKWLEDFLSTQTGKGFVLVMLFEVRHSIRNQFPWPN